MQHSKLPWQIIECVDDTGIVCKESGDIVVSPFADAAFIVKAANNYENLKHAAWLAHEHMKLYLPHYKAGFSVFDELEKAIKEAKEWDI